MEWAEPRNPGVADHIPASGAPYRVISSLLPGIQSHTYEALGSADVIIKQICVIIV